MNSLKILGIIPSRYGSTRFPGKPLVKIGGESMLSRVITQVRKSNVDEVWVATDDDRIAEEASQNKTRAILTDSNLPSGTDRCRQAYQKANEKFDIIINIQGDEPFIDPSQINALIDLMKRPEVGIGTLVTHARDMDEISNPNRVKVAVDKNGKALYFSRSLIPFNRSTEQADVKRYFLHLGIYGFDAATFIRLDALGESFLEKTESLEQLRWLENGYPVHTAYTEIQTDSIDTPEDLERIEKKYLL